GEQRRFITAGAGANFENDVFLVIGIFRQQQDLQFLFNSAYARLQFRKFFLGVGAHVRVRLRGQHGLAFGDSAFEVLVLAIFFDDWRNLTMRLRGLLIFGGVVHRLGRGEGSRELVVARFG